MDPRIQSIQGAVAHAKNKLEGRKPLVGIVLGSGLGGLADKIEEPLIIPYRDIPDFPVSTATGHKGNFIIGKLGGKEIIAMQGRIHYYEGYPMEYVVLPIRVMMGLGIKYLFVSNAAGGINYNLHLGDLMIIKDHINMLPNPLIGPNMDDEGPRFPDMTRPYDPTLIKLALHTAIEMGIELKQGVYLGNSGPSYETPAEYKFYRTIGADAVGMSTVPEVIVARHANVSVFGISVITNEAHDNYGEEYENNGEEVVKAAAAASDKMSRLLARIIENL
jgi:purine-nucleoside phosphorylase